MYSNALKVIEVKDDGVYLISIPNGLYKVDGEVLKVSGYGQHEIQALSCEIYPISTASIITHYENSRGTHCTETRYNNKLKELANKGVEDSRYGRTFANPDDEYAYKKWQRDWSAIFRRVTTVGDALPVEKAVITMDTGCEFITPILSTKAMDKLYKYDRTTATHSLTVSTFTSLGMSFEGNLSYGQTSNKKVWGNSTHSHLEYVTAFGHYLWTKTKQPKQGVYRGNLEQCKAMYDGDKKYIEKIIKSGYAKHFNKCSSFVLGDLLKRLEKIHISSLEVCSKQKTYNEWRSLTNKLDALIGDVREELANSV